MNRNDLIKKILLTTIAGYAGAKGVVWLGRKAVDKAADSFVNRIMIDPYSENLWELISATKKMGPQNIVETNLRAQEGQIINRPLGSPKKFPDFNGVMFDFAQLLRRPVDEGKPVNTRVIIGPSAQNPLELDLPMMISGMAYAFALSARAKIALAKGASLAGTSTNTGEGPFLLAERKAANKLIIQYNRGKWNKSAKVLKQADMIEIHIGQGAAGGVGHYIKDSEIDWKIRRKLGLGWGEKAVVHANFPDMNKPGDLKDLIDYLRNVTRGVPIGVKLAAGKFLEEDLEIAVASGVDVIALDTAKAGSKGTAPIFQDDFGLPNIFALARAGNFFRKHKLKHKVSLILAGGLVTPGDFLKAIALGADAVYIGGIALLAMSHTQILKSTPWEPPPEVVFYKGKFEKKFDVNKGAQNLANFLLACNKEIENAVRALGKSSIHEVNKDDLFALDPMTAEIADIPLGYKEIRSTQGTSRGDGHFGR